MATVIPFAGEQILSLRYTGYKLPLSAQEADGSFTSSATVANNGECSQPIGYFANNTGLPVSSQSGPFFVKPIALTPVWQKLKVHILGDVIQDPNGNLQICVQAGTSAALSPQVLGGWGFIPGTLTADDNTFLHQVIWQCVGPKPNPAAWQYDPATQSRFALNNIFTLARFTKHTVNLVGATVDPWQVLTSQSEDQIPTWLFAYDSLPSGAPPMFHPASGLVCFCALNLAQAPVIAVATTTAGSFDPNPTTTLPLAGGSPVFSSLVGPNQNPYQLFGYAVVLDNGAPAAMIVGNGQLNGANKDAAGFFPFAGPSDITWHDVTATQLWKLHSQQFLSIRFDEATGENFILGYDPTFSFFRLTRLTIDAGTLAPTFTVVGDFTPASDPVQGILFGSQFAGTQHGWIIYSSAGIPDPAVPNGSPVFLFAPDLSSYSEVTFTTSDPAVEILAPPDIVGPNFAFGSLSIPMIGFDPISGLDMLLWQNPGLFASPGSIDPHAGEVYYALFGVEPASAGRIVGTHVGIFAGGGIGGGQNS